MFLLIAGSTLLLAIVGTVIIWRLDSKNPKFPPPDARIVAIVFVSVWFLLGFLAFALWWILSMSAEDIAHLRLYKIYTYIVTNEWLTVPLILLAAVLYRIKCTSKFYYGVLEILVGVAGVWAALHVHGSEVVTGIVLETQNGLMLSKSLAAAGGVYVIIRGLTNVSEQLPEDWEDWWRVVFNQKTK